MRREQALFRKALRIQQNRRKIRLAAVDGELTAPREEFPKQAGRPKTTDQLKTTG